MHEIYDILRKKNFINRGKVQISTIHKLTTLQIHNLADEIHAVIKRNKRVQDVYMTHSASRELSGDASPCSSLECRKKHMNKLSRFAALYSDCVYIPSFFIKHKTFRGKDAIDQQRYHLFNDLYLLQQIQPLIECGYIRLYYFPDSICKSCLGEICEDKHLPVKVKKIINHISGKYQSHLDVHYGKRGNEYFMRINAPYPFLEHKTFRLSKKPHPELKKRKRLLSRVDHGEVIKASKTLINSIGVLKNLAGNNVWNAILAHYCSISFKTAFVTENELDVESATMLHQDESIKRVNSIMAQHFTTFVPCVDDLSLKETIKLRKNEEDSFIQFRSALKEIISETVRAKGKFDMRDAKELYGDVLEPAICNLQIKVKQAKRKHLKKAYRNASGLIGSIAIGVLCGVIRPDIVPILGLLGIKPVAEMISSTMAIQDGSEVIQNERFYFLWKMHQKCSR
ncbi:MAG: hypothetical protein JXA82_01365 [Sedimentisphaerales bacterium]|nr:hypothetical protein [Sedimentisphaerales bacterium]